MCGIFRDRDLEDEEFAAIEANEDAMEVGKVWSFWLFRMRRSRAAADFLT